VIEIVTGVIFFLGCLTSAVIAFAVLFWLLFFAIPAIWNEFCFACYSAFADKARKQAIRDQERQALKDNSHD
jgi:hypothetical protein